MPCFNFTNLTIKAKVVIISGNLYKRNKKGGKIMEKFCNMETFLNNLNYSNKMNDEIINLLTFTSKSKVDRNKINVESKIEKNAKDNYLFNYNQKKYPFSILSDKNLQKCDIKILKDNEKRRKIEFLRTLKLACSMDLINPRVAIGNSVLGNLYLIILYQEKGIDKVIDYSSNLIMNKDDYYELFKFKELNIVSKAELYKIHYLIEKIGNQKNLYEYLLFTNEILEDLSKYEKLNLIIKYQQNGINMNNASLLGNHCDCLYFIEKDYDNLAFKKIREELANFTLNPKQETDYIKYDRSINQYSLNAKDFGYFTFNLLSDQYKNEDLKKQLLSDTRYEECHKNSVLTALSLREEDRKSAHIVGGKIKANDVDYFFHSWVEVDDINTVIDFNRNLIMNKYRYYKLFGAVAINRTSIDDMIDIIKTVVFDAKLDIHPMTLNYFGKELMNDLKKNEKILKK